MSTKPPLKKVTMEFDSKFNPVRYYAFLSASYTKLNVLTISVFPLAVADGEFEEYTRL